MTTAPAILASLSAAMDGGFTGVADVSQAMTAAGAADDYRLIGGVTVMLHVQRLGLDLPLRATGDADFGVPPHVLRRPELVNAIEALGYTIADKRPMRRSPCLAVPPATSTYAPILWCRRGDCLSHPTP